MNLLTFDGGWVVSGDCILGMREMKEESVDFIFADPPFAIGFDKSAVFYNRIDTNVAQGYQEVEVPKYPQFTRYWIGEAVRVLKDGGAMWIMSGWTHSHIVARWIARSGLSIVNKLVWEYNFGVWTTRKFVTCHYEMFYCLKGRDARRVFHRRFPEDNKACYADRQSVWRIKRAYQPGIRKNATKLPDELVRKVLEHCTNPGHVVLDPFLGNGTTLFVGLDMNRAIVGFEKNPEAFAVIRERMDDRGRRVGEHANG